MAEQQCMQCFAKAWEKLSGGELPTVSPSKYKPEQGERKTKFDSKSIFHFLNACKTVGPLINLQSVQLLLFGPLIHTLLRG